MTFIGRVELILSMERLSAAHNLAKLKTPAAFHAAYMPQSEFNSQLEIQNQNFPEFFLENKLFL